LKLLLLTVLTFVFLAFYLCLCKLADSDANA
jgi:hypothetical protein